MNRQQEAEDLRRQGYTYKEIVQLLDGAVSIDWCKRNLKGLKQKEDNTICIQEIKELAIRPEGVSEYEATGVVYKHFENASVNKVRYIKRMIKKDPTCLIRPDWMDTHHPTESFKSIMALSVHLADEISCLVEDFMGRYHRANPWSVKHEILKLAFSDKVSVEPLTNRIRRNEVLIETLEERMEMEAHQGTQE